MIVQVHSRCKCAEVVQWWCRAGGGENAEVQVQGLIVQRCRGVLSRCCGSSEVIVQVQSRCKSADNVVSQVIVQVQRCRGAEVQRCRGAEVQIGA